MPHRHLPLFVLTVAACSPEEPGGGQAPAQIAPAAVQVVDLDGLPPTWVTGTRVQGVVAIGDLDGDGSPEFSVTSAVGDEPEYFVSGPINVARDLRTDAIAQIGPYPRWAGNDGDIDGDGRADLARLPGLDVVEYVFGPVSPLSTEAVLGAVADAVLPTWRSSGFVDAAGVVGLRRTEADGSFTFVPGPVANWEIGAGSLHLTWEAVNPDPDSYECSWTEINPAIHSLGDLDGDGTPELGLFPFGHYSNWCADFYGYLVPEPFPAEAHFTLAGIAGWAQFTDLRAVPDQTGDGVNDALLWVELGGWHLFAGPVSSVDGTLVHGGELGAIQEGYDLAIGESVPDVTGDGQTDWIVFDSVDGVQSAVLKPGGVDSIFDTEVAAVAAWTTWQHGANFAVSGDLVLFPAETGVAIIDLIP